MVLVFRESVTRCLLCATTTPPLTHTNTYTAAAKLMFMKLTTYRIQNTAAAKLMYIKLPMYLALGLNNFDGGKSIIQAIERGRL